MTNINNGEPVLTTTLKAHAGEMAAQNGKVVFRCASTDPSATDGFVYTIAYMHEGTLLREGWEYWPDWFRHTFPPASIYMDEYQSWAAKTSGAYGKGQGRVLWATVALCGEVGEFANLVKKKYNHGHNIPLSVFAIELGDISWYVAELASALGLSLLEIARANIQKLRARYPQGFSKDTSINRNN
jgi:NTP pyrophosphatase (non-canonical NTP hydrolase)